MHSMTQNPSESSFHLCVSQAVDDGVQHGGDNPIEHRDEPVSGRGVSARRWADVGKYGRAIEQTDYKEVGRTCGEGFALPFHRLDPEDGGDDVDVRDEGGQEGTDPKNTSHH